MNTKIWYHGAERRMAKWFPLLRTAAPEPVLSSQGSLILYDTPTAAAQNGPVITTVRLKQDAAVLDVADDKILSERLRLAVAAHHLLKHSDNIKQAFWHAGWKTGAMLRLSVTAPGFEQKIHQQISRQAEESDKSFQTSSDAFFRELSNEMTCHILITASDMGYDGLTGYLPSNSVYEKPARFLVVFSPDILKKYNRSSMSA